MGESPRGAAEGLVFLRGLRQGARIDHGASSTLKRGEESRLAGSIEGPHSPSTTGVRAVANLFPVSGPLATPGEAPAATVADPIRAWIGHPDDPARHHHQMKSKTRRKPP